MSLADEVLNMKSLSDEDRRQIQQDKLNIKRTWDTLHDNLEWRNKRYVYFAQMTSSSLNSSLWRFIYDHALIAHFLDSLVKQPNLKVSGQLRSKNGKIKLLHYNNG